MGLGPWHLLAIVIIVLVFFGPSRLPSLGKSMGEAIRGFKKVMQDDEIDVTDSARRESLNAAPPGETTQTQKTRDSARDKNRS